MEQHAALIVTDRRGVRGVLRRIARRWRGAVAIVLAWAIFVTAGSTPEVAEAQELPPPTLTPPALLNPFLLSPGFALSGSLYDATQAQRAALGRLEAQAITNSLRRFGLPASDAVAMKSWGRFEATGELWALLVEAIQTEPAARSADQQLAVEWFTDVVKRQQDKTARQTGLEYLHWAGLDDTAYRRLLDQPEVPTKAAIRATLAGEPVNFGNGPAGLATTGYCAYHPPAAFESQYTGRSNQTCFTPCTVIGGCLPPYPTFDQLKSWAAGRVNERLFHSADYAGVSREVAHALILAGAVVAAGLTAAVISLALTAVLTGAAISTAVAAVFSGAVAAAEFGTATLAGTSVTLTATGAGMVAAAAAAAIAIIIIAIVTAVLAGIHVISGALLPDKVAELVADALGHVPDLRALLGDQGQVAGLFSLFIGATLPSPKLATCDNGWLIGGGGQVPVPCLNAPPIPERSASDPWFEVTEDGSSQSTVSRTINVRDDVTKVDSLTRLHDSWFIRHLTDKDGASIDVQSLRLRYTDWDGNQRTAMVVKEDSGWTFVQIKDTGVTRLDSCEQEGWCETSATLKYLGADGKHYSAKVVPPPPPPPDVVAPTMSVASLPAFQAEGPRPVLSPELVSFSEPVRGAPRFRLVRDGIDVGVFDATPILECRTVDGALRCVTSRFAMAGSLPGEPGVYELTVLTDGVTDLAGNAVVGGDVTVSWTVVEQLQAVVGSPPALVGEPVGEVAVTFNRAATLELDDLVLTHDGTPVPWGPGVDVVPDGPAGEPATRWVISGLGSAQRDGNGGVVDGVYQLSFRDSVVDVHGVEWFAPGGSDPTMVAEAVEFTVDAVDPPPTITVSPDAPDGEAGWYRSAVTVALTPAAGMTETRCVADPAVAPASFEELPESWQDCAGVYGDGVHRLYAASRDNVAGPGAVNQISFRIDQTAPVTSIILDPAVPDGAQGWYVAPVGVNVTVDEPATVRCALNPEREPVSFAELPAGPCDPFTVSDYGHYTVYAAAVDPAGNPAAMVHTAFKSVGALRCQGQPPTHVATAAADVIVGSARSDVILAFGGGDTIHGRGGDDLICAAGGNDRVDGGDGADTLSAGPGNDWLTGAAGDDRLLGQAGGDRLGGGDDDDTLSGGTGRDQLTGHAGNDQLSGGANPDRLYAGPGSDAVGGHAGNDLILGAAGNDHLTGHTGHDLILAGTGDDHLTGGAGNDRLFAGPGNDHLDGGPGNDLLDPGPGNDHLNPGPGHNTTLTTLTTPR
jgi:hypothetical protein